MPVANTRETYGVVTKTFHWLTALLILTAFPLGIIANNMPFDTGEALAQKAWLFSLHKTVGVAAFLIASGRILWAITQPKPVPLHPDRKAETFLAEMVHWLLYASMLIVPLSGWIHHAATAGFAPILWPFGQNLPLIPKSLFVEEVFKEIHFIFTKVLALSVLLHIAGALKHAVIDKDGTLARMTHGSKHPPAATAAAHGSARTPLYAAVVVYLLGFGGAFGLVSQHDTSAVEEVAALSAVASEWQVTEGTLSIGVQQLGSDIQGSFADWTAAITFDESAADGVHGSVTVEIAIGSLTLGSVTNEALAADFFNAADFPIASFSADILAADDGYVAEGTLSLRGADVPVTLPFQLDIVDETAQMSGRVALDRRDFSMGASYPDESTVGFGVAVEVDVTAQRAAPSS